MVRPSVAMGEEVECQRPLQIGRVEIHHVIDPPGRDMLEQLLSKITVRVDYANPLPCCDVLQDQVSKKCRLPRAGLANHVQVLPPVLTTKEQRLFAAPTVPISDENGIIVILLSLLIVALHVPEQTATPGRIPAA